MRRLRFVGLFALSAAVVLATAASAYAGTSGTVYGQATMQPTVSIVLSGAGADPGNPLVYSGAKGDWRQAAGAARLTVTNDGGVEVPLMLGYDSDPTDGVDTWTIGSGPGETRCDWHFMDSTLGMWADVPSSGGSPASFGPPLAAGASVFDTLFQFPLAYTGTPHTMTALIIAGS